MDLGDNLSKQISNNFWSIFLTVIIKQECLRLRALCPACPQANKLTSHKALQQPDVHHSKDISRPAH